MRPLFVNIIRYNIMLFRYQPIATSPSKSMRTKGETKFSKQINGLKSEKSKEINGRKMKKSKEIIVLKYAFSWKSGKNTLVFPWKSGRNHLFLSWKKGNALLFFYPSNPTTFKKNSYLCPCLAEKHPLRGV